MFAQSYNPFGNAHPPSPRLASEKRKREENARRRRIIERLRLEERQQQEEKERYRHRRLDSMLTQPNEDDMVDETLFFPPPFIYATVTKSNDEMDQDQISKSPPPRMISARADSAIASHIEKPHVPRRSVSESSTIFTRASNCQAKDESQNKIDQANVQEHNDDDVLAPPHIMADDDLSDDDNEDEESLNSVWMSKAPVPGQIGPNTSFQTYE